MSRTLFNEHIKYAEEGAQAKRRRVTVLCWIILVIIIVALGSGAGLMAIMARRKQNSGKQLQRIVLALHSYHSSHSHFPPPHFVDITDRRTKSWRTCILPDLDSLEDRQPIAAHRAYDSTKPWDAPENQRARSMRVQVFESPLAGKTPGKTNYVVVVGRQTAFPVSPGWGRNYAPSFSDMIDGPRNTILVIEIANSDIEWAEPRDLDFDTLLFAEAAPPGSKNVIVAGALVGMGDGSVGFLDRKLTLAELKACVTASAGERVRSPIAK